MKKVLFHKLTITIMAALLLLACAVGAYFLLQSCVWLFRGDVAVKLTTGGTALLNGKAESSAYLALQDDIFLPPQALSGAMGPAVRIGVCSLGLTRFVPMLICLALLCVFFANLLRGKPFLKQNIPLLIITGLVLTFAAILAPVCNAYIIPFFVNLAAPGALSTGVNLLAGPKLWWGVAVLLLAYFVNKAAQAEANAQQIKKGGAVGE